jgi:hypothetical protein
MHLDFTLLFPPVFGITYMYGVIANTCHIKLRTSIKLKFKRLKKLQFLKKKPVHTQQINKCNQTIQIGKQFCSCLGQKWQSNLSLINLKRKIFSHRTTEFKGRAQEGA